MRATYRARNAPKMAKGVPNRMLKGNDQLSYWAITVGTNIAGYAPAAGPLMREILLGGNEVGQNALIRFYTLHIALLPLLITLLVSVHIWRVRKDGGLAAGESNE